MEVRGKRELEVAVTPSGAVGLPPDWMNIKFWSLANNHPSTCLLLRLRRLKYVSAIKSNIPTKCMTCSTWHEFDTQFQRKKCQPPRLIAKAQGGRGKVLECRGKH